MTPEETTSASSNASPGSGVSRPGISPEGLAAAGIVHIDAATAQEWCGIYQPSTLIPYFYPDGMPVLHNGRQYGRARLDVPVGDSKYHQAAGSPVVVYFPPGLGTLTATARVRGLVVVEGEFKALSLVEAGIPAIGICGFYGFGVRVGDIYAPVPSLLQALQILDPNRILFLGDSDTAVNWQFADAAVKLVHAVGVEVDLVRIPIGGPGKGVDDCREALGEGFLKWWGDRVADAVPLTRHTRVDDLAVRLLLREADPISKLGELERGETQRRVIKLAANVTDSIASDEIQKFALTVFGTKARAFKDAVKAQRHKMAQEINKAAAWVDGMPAPDGRQRVRLPGPGRDLSAFASDVARVLGPRADWFNRDGVIQIVSRNTKTGRSYLKVLEPVAAITSLERAIQTGTLKGEIFQEQSMTAEIAAPLLASEALINSLPRIDRILNVPVPVEKDGVVTLPLPGLNREHNLWLSEDAPVVSTGDLQLAVKWIDWLLEDFPFSSKQDRIHYSAYLITPMVKGLFARWNCRTPLFVFSSNRQRVGKDYAAGVAGMIYEGEPREENPITKDTAELEKRVTAALLSGATRLHFSECEGRLDNTVLQGVITKGVYSARVLGKSTMFSCSNELVVSLSGKNDLTLSTDLALRSRTINMQFFPEDANARVFRFPDLHGEVLKHRSAILSAFITLVKHWVDQGRPSGPTPFASFPDWARVVGGILVTAGLGDPCLPQVSDILPMDTDTTDMMHLFGIMADRPGATGYTTGEVVSIIESHPEASIFQHLNLEDRTDRGKLGKLLRRFNHRELGGVRMTFTQNPAKTERSTFHFTRITGGVGVSGGQI